MSWETVADWLAAVCFIVGAVLILFTGIGMYRFPELLSRMHAGTKPQVLGTIMMMSGLAFSLRTPVATWTLLLVVAFQIITAPVSAHMVARAGYRTHKIRQDLMVVDEFAIDLAEMRKRQAAAKAEAEAKAEAAKAQVAAERRRAEEVEQAEQDQERPPAAQ